MSASATTSFLLLEDDYTKTTKQNVIASEAKQSIVPQVEKWIASSLSLLAMTKTGRKDKCD
jgi:hypothetical protein